MLNPSTMTTISKWMTRLAPSNHHTRTYSSGLSLQRHLLILQENDEACRKKIENTGKFILYHKKGLRPLITRNNLIHWLSSDDLRNYNIDVSKSNVLLSLNENSSAVCALSVSSETAKPILENNEEINFTDLRFGMFTINENVVSLLTRGWSLLKWHEKNNFCANCGSSELIRNVAGNKISCSKCPSVIYPHTSPVGIVLVTNKNKDKILLVHLDRHPNQMYSCVAGFVDSGETLEECVRRELAEEVGLIVDSIEYSCSQHWPFPRGSLMMGCTAVSEDEKYDPLPGEVEDARWFNVDEIRLALDNQLESYFIPPKGTIANKLIRNWLKTYHNN